MNNPFKTLIQMFEDPTIPVGGKIYKDNTIEFQNNIKYDYATIEKLLQDERVYSIVAMVASMVQKAYIGPELHPENRYIDKELTPKEEKVMLAAEKVARTLKFKQLCFDYAWQLITHGDVFEEIEKDGEGVRSVTSLPLNSIRILESQAQEQANDITILKEEMISLRTNENDTAPRFIHKEDYLHLSFKSHGVWRKDIKNVDTYNLWSIPPIASLQRLVDWKKKTIENDIIWKNKLLPRILYKLKMPSIVPSKYTGTPEEKVSKAQADAELLTNKFTTSVKTLRPDDDITISDAVDAEMLEAKSTNYQKPNETIGQINGLLNGPQGVSSNFLGGEGGASLANELSAIFAGIRVEYLVSKIGDGLTELMKRNANIVTPGSEDIIERLYIHTDSALTVERFQKMKTAIAMASTGLYTIGEVRRISGHPRLPQLPKEAFPDDRLIGNKKQLSDIETEEAGKEGRNNRSEKAVTNSMENKDPETS